MKTSELTGAALAWAVAKCKSQRNRNPGRTRMKTSELTGAALDWAVAKCEGYYTTIKPNEVVYAHPNGAWHHNANWQPATNWAQGGPIIERDGIHLGKSGVDWEADFWNMISLNFDRSYGPTPLIAAMRCYVASKLGDEVELPKELL